MDKMIKITGLGHSYQTKRVLENLNLEIKKGEIFGLLGPSGAGKTTLIKILTGQLKPTEGTACLFGKNATQLTGADYQQIGIMMDCFGLYERMSCYENLKFYAQLYGVSKERILQVLEQVGLADAKKTLAMNLSKGMRNRLLMARAFLREPAIIFLDEPTSGLDPATTEEIHKMIYAEKKKGVTIFLTTHNMTEAEKLCDKISLLNEGHIVEYGKPEEICRRYNHQKKIMLHLKNGADVELPHDSSSAAQISDYLANAQIETIHSTEPSLESVFMELTGRVLE